MHQKPPLKAWGLLFLLALIWGSSFILIKKGLLGLSSPEVGALRIFTAFVVMAPVAFLSLRNIRWDQVKYLIVVGLTGSLVPAFLFAIAQTKTPSSITGVINALTPIFTLLVGVVIYRQKTTVNAIVGVLVGFVGAAVLVLSDSGSLSTFNYYALLIVMATILYAINVNVIKHHLQGLRSLTITSISLLMVGPFCGAYLYFGTSFFENLAIPEVQTAALYIFMLGLFGTAIALIIFNKLVQLTDAVFTSSVTYIIPIVAIVWGLFDGESLMWAHWLGMGLILAGVYLTTVLGKK